VPGHAAGRQPAPPHRLPAARGRPARTRRRRRRPAISLAFITAPQLLPPRRRAALVLRDVLGYHAAEAAQILDAVESLSHRVGD